MAKDVLFKTMTFGGFNKEDVLEYIRAQQTQLTDTQRKLKETEENAAAASKRTRELETLLSEQQTRAEEYFALSEEYAKRYSPLKTKSIPSMRSSTALRSAASEQRMWRGR